MADGTSYPAIYEADEIASSLAVVDDNGEAIPQEWTPYDELGRQYIVDLTATGQAFIVTVEPWTSIEDEGVED